MHKRLHDFLEVNNVLHSLQFGFRKEHSTSHTLISMTEKIINKIGNGKYGCGVFIDIKKSFQYCQSLHTFKKDGTLWGERNPTPMA